MEVKVHFNRSKASPIKGTTTCKSIEELQAYLQSHPFFQLTLHGGRQALIHSFTVSFILEVMPGDKL